MMSKQISDNKLYPYAVFMAHKSNHRVVQLEQGIVQNHLSIDASG